MHPSAGLETFLAAGEDSGAAGAPAASAWRSRPLWGHTGRQFSAAFAPLSGDAAGGAQQRQLLATASEDQTARVWDADSGKCIRCLEDAHKDEVLRVAWSGNGAMLATGGADGAAKLWRAADDWPCLATLEHGEGKQIYALRYDSHASGSQQLPQQLLTACDDTIARWDLGSANSLAQAWSFPSIGLDAHGGPARNQDETIDVFDVAISEAAEGGGEGGGSGSPGREALLAAALGDGSVRVIDPRSPALVALLLDSRAGDGGGGGAPAVTGVDFSPSVNELVREHAPPTHTRPVTHRETHKLLRGSTALSG
jgi:WD40 repeat protein